MIKRVSLSGAAYVDWRGRLFAIGIGLALGLVLVELLGRAIHYLPSPPSPSYLDLTNAVGPLPEPSSGFNNTFDGVFSQWVEFNALGFRGPVTDFPINDDRQRVLVLGDSYTAAWQIPLQDRWTEKMQQIHPGWVILNLGMPNWGTDQEYLTLLNYPPRQPPDLVLLMFSPINDVSDNARLELTGNPPNHPYFVPDGVDKDNNLLLLEVPWRYDNPFDRPGGLPFPTNVRKWLYLHSVSYHLASDLKNSLRKDNEANITRLPVPTDPHRAPLEAGVFRTRETPEWTLAWKITEALLLRIRSAAEVRGARFVIVVDPPYGLIQPDLRPEYVAADPEDFDLSEPLIHLSNFAKANNISLLDLTPGFEQYFQSDPHHQNLFYPGEAHFTPLGNCIAAVMITNWLVPQAAADTARCRQEQGLVDRSEQR